MNFLLKWQEARLDAISARAMLDSMDMTRELNVPYIPKADEYEWSRVGGLDIAKANDSTVVTALEVDLKIPSSSRTT